MSTEERKRPEYSPTYLQVLRPERVVSDVSSAEEIHASNQLMHDKTDALGKEVKELKEENANLRRLFMTQMESIYELKEMIAKVQK